MKKFVMIGGCCISMCMAHSLWAAQVSPSSQYTVRPIPTMTQTVTDSGVVMVEGKAVKMEFKTVIPDDVRKKRRHAVTAAADKSSNNAIKGGMAGKIPADEKIYSAGDQIIEFKCGVIHQDGGADIDVSDEVLAYALGKAVAYDADGKGAVVKIRVPKAYVDTVLKKIAETCPACEIKSTATAPTPVPFPEFLEQAKEEKSKTLFAK